MNQSTVRDLYRGRNPREIPACTAKAASHYLHVPEKTIRNWSAGYAYGTRTGTARTKPLIEATNPQRHLLSFINLLELHVISALRRVHEVRMVKIRRAIDYLQRELPRPHALIDKEMETDGTDIFVTKVGTLINASREGQPALKAALHAHLRRIERDRRIDRRRTRVDQREGVRSEPKGSDPSGPSLDSFAEKRRRDGGL